MQIQIVQQTQNHNIEKYHNRQNHLRIYTMIVHSIQPKTTQSLNKLIYRRIVTYYHQIDRHRSDHILQTNKEVTHKLMEKIIAQKCKHYPRHANHHNNDLANKNASTLLRIMHRIHIIAVEIVVLQTVPAELMPARTSHVRAPRRLLYRNLTFRTLVCQKDEVNKPKNTLYVPPRRLNQSSLTFRTPLILHTLPFAFLHREHIVATL